MTRRRVQQIITTPLTLVNKCFNLEPWENLSVQTVQWKLHQLCSSVWSHCGEEMASFVKVGSLQANNAYALYNLYFDALNH